MQDRWIWIVIFGLPMAKNSWPTCISDRDRRLLGGAEIDKDIRPPSKNTRFKHLGLVLPTIAI